MTSIQQENTLFNLLSDRCWQIEERGFDPNKISHYETVFTIGNGYLGTRGNLDSPHGASLPATYIKGIFDHNDSTITDMVNMPDWTPIEIISNNELLSEQNCEILDFHRVLDMKQGFLYKFTRFKDKKGNITFYESIRYASFADPNFCEIKVRIIPENYSGEFFIHSEMNGDVYNLDRIPAYENNNFDPDMEWKKWAKSKHLRHISTKIINENDLYMEVKTMDRLCNISFASSLKVDNSHIQPICDYKRVKHLASVKVSMGEAFDIEKLVTINTSKERSILALEKTCTNKLKEYRKLSFETRFDAHKKEWEKKWQDCDCVIVGDIKSQRALRFDIYHLLIAANRDPKTSIGAKGLTGEGYKGHVFWDTEIFLLPFYIFTQPEIAKSLLLYRYNTLSGARKNASLSRRKGAKFAWESADTGLEETPEWSADGVNRIWPGEEEIHITADVVRGLINYIEATSDIDFELKYAAPIIFETARFWASRLEYKKDCDRFELTKVIGPDEYHEHVSNSVFTNRMVKWNLEVAVNFFREKQEKYPLQLGGLMRDLGLGIDEVNNWEYICDKIYILYDFETRLFEEFEGYFDLENVPILERDKMNMPLYPIGYGDFNCSKTNLVKQADIIALFHLLPFCFDQETKRANYSFYEPKTMHASSLSASIYAILSAEMGNTQKAYEYFRASAFIDIDDYKHSTKTGVHMAAAGGTWQVIIHGFFGMRVKNGQLVFNPAFPKNWQEISCKIKWQGLWLKLRINKSEIEFFWDAEANNQLTIELQGKNLVLPPEEAIIAKLS